MSSCPAQYFDGLSATPKAGTLQVQAHVLVFTQPQGQRVSVSVDELAPARFLGKDVILECRIVDLATPSAYWVVNEPDFEAILKPTLKQIRATFGRRIPVWVWILLCVVLLPIAFMITMQAAELGHWLVPVEKEIAMGEAFYQSMAVHANPCTDPGISNVLNQIAQELRDPDSPYTPVISVWYDDAPNAFALPGGHIIVLTGIFPLVGGPDAMAGVLAHELAHIEKRHSLKQIMRSVGLMTFSSAVIGGSIEGLDALEQAAEMSSMLALLKYSRDAEHEADLVAVEKLHSRGYSVTGMEQFFDKLKKHENGEGIDMGNALSWLSTHPGTDDRQTFLATKRTSETFKPKQWDLPAATWTHLPPATSNNRAGLFGDN